MEEKYDNSRFIKLNETQKLSENDMIIKRLANINAEFRIKIEKMFNKDWEMILKEILEEEKQ